MTIEWLERFIAFSIKMSIFTYLTNSINLGGLGCSRTCASIAYGLIELAYYLTLSIYATGFIGLYSAIYIGILSLITSTYIIAHTIDIVWIYIGTIALGTGMGLIKSGALHTISSLFDKADDRVRALFVYLGIINFGGLVGNLVCILNSQFAIFYHTIYSIVHYLTVLMLFMFIGYRKELKSHNDKVMLQDQRLIADSSEVKTYDSMTNIIKQAKWHILYLMIGLAICGMSISITCLTTINYLTSQNYNSVQVFSFSIPTPTLISINPILIILLSFISQPSNNTRRYTRLGYLINSIGYALYASILVIYYPIIATIIFIASVAISELYLSINCYNGLLSIFRNIHPANISKIIALTYLSMGLVAMLNNSIATYIIDLGIYIYVLYSISLVNLAMFWIGKRFRNDI